MLQGLSNIIWALSDLGLQPPPAWLYHWAAATRGVLSQMSPVDLGQVASALQSPVLEPLQLPKLESLLLDVLDRLATVELQSGAYIRAAVERLMRMTTANAFTGSNAVGSNGREVLQEIVQQQQHSEVMGDAAAAADGGNGHVGNDSMQHTAVDSDVQQLKQLLAQQVLTPRPRRPAHSA